jgi:plasmid stabilization system protein ParE
VRYEIEVQPSAERDINEIYVYLLGFGGRKADAWLDSIQNAFKSLEQMPERCALAPENPLFRREVRQLLCQSYRIVFTIVGDDVRILHVRHKAQAPLEP